MPDPTLSVPPAPTSDPASPLDRLPAPLRTAMLAKGFATTTPVQEAVLDAIAPDPAEAEESHPTESAPAAEASAGEAPGAEAPGTDSPTADDTVAAADDSADAGTPQAAGPEAGAEATAAADLPALPKRKAAPARPAKPGPDLRISSQTGSGKTVALGIAIAGELIAACEEGRERAPGPLALIVVPTRELAAQVQTELSWLFSEIGRLRVESVTGGTNVGQERRRLGWSPQVLVGTPGRLVDHLGSGALNLSAVRELVLDEADQMLDLGFREDLDAIVAAATSGDERPRCHMVSATFSPAVKALAKAFQRDPRIVAGTPPGDANADIVHVGHVVRAKDRYDALVNLLLMAGEERALVFVATRAAASTLAEKLTADGFAAEAISGELAQTQRTRTLAAFRSGSVRVLVATDVAARGLDVPDVGQVIHGDLPMDAEGFVHRSGRTGRAGQKGRSVILATPNNHRRARRFANEARVDVDWQPLPDADAVRRAVDGRFATQTRVIVTDANAGEADRALAAELLEGRDPADVVAALVAARRGSGVTDARSVEAPSVPRSDRSDYRSERPERSGYRSDHRSERSDFRAERSGYRAERSELRPERPAPRGERSVAAGPRAADGRHRSESGFTRFRINWGARAGANPRRLLAAICRRGDVPGTAIGSIDIAAFETTFDVANDVAGAFEAAVRRPDDRHTNQVIERADRESRRHARAR